MDGAHLLDRLRPASDENLFTFNVIE